MKIDCSFPGGNIVVERIEGDEAWLHQDLRDTTTDWFYWCFRVTGAEGRTVRFHFTRSPVLGSRGPAVGTGTNWNWLGQVEGNSFAHRFGPEDREVFFSMTIPYLEVDWKRFITSHAGSLALEERILCASAQGRPVELVTFGNLSSPRYRVLLTCRHHACESMASHALEGWISFVLSGEEPEARWLRENVGFLAVPFVDKDGCEAGDQGKNRRPHDHNRDYGDTLYPETAALRAQVPAWAEEKLQVVFDLHCPWLRDGLNEKVYLVGSDRPEMWREQQRYSAFLEKGRRGSLPFFAADNLPYGQDWNTAENFSAGTSCTQWASALPDVHLATTVEIPYANAHGGEVNRGSALALGADLARACASYLQGLDPECAGKK